MKQRSAWGLVLACLLFVTGISGRVYGAPKALTEARSSAETVHLSTEEVREVVAADDPYVVLGDAEKELFLDFFHVLDAAEVHADSTALALCHQTAHQGRSAVSVEDFMTALIDMTSLMVKNIAVFGPEGANLFRTRINAIFPRLARYSLDCEHPEMLHDEQEAALVVGLAGRDIYVCHEEAESIDAIAVGEARKPEAIWEALLVQCNIPKAGVVFGRVLSIERDGVIGRNLKVIGTLEAALIEVCVLCVLQTLQVNFIEPKSPEMTITVSGSLFISKKAMYIPVRIISSPV